MDYAGPLRRGRYDEAGPVLCFFVCASYARTPTLFFRMPEEGTVFSWKFPTATAERFLTKSSLWAYSIFSNLEHRIVLS